MTARLRLSVNELSSILRQVCKATYSAHHDYITIRETVLWMHLQGFDGLNAVLGDYIDDGTCPRQSSFGCDPMSWSLAGESLIPVAHMAGDLLLAESADSLSVQIVIENANYPSSLLLELYRLMLSGLKAHLVVDGQVLAVCGAGELQVLLYAKDWPTHAEKTIIIVGGEPSPLEAAALTLSDILAKSQRAYDAGIFVDPEMYASLNARAVTCLVPTTEESRRGAGE